MSPIPGFPHNAAGLAKNIGRALDENIPLTIVMACRSGRHRTAEVGKVLEGALFRMGTRGIRTHLRPCSRADRTCGAQCPGRSLRSKRAAELSGEGLM